MAGHQGQSLTSWIMLVPLLIVPLVAVFGVPKLDLLYTANAEGEEPDIELEQGQGTPFDDSMPPMPSEQMNLGTPHASSAPLANAQSSRPGNEGWANPFDDPGVISNTANSADNTESSHNAGAFVDPFTADRVQNSSQLIAENSAGVGNQSDPFAARNAGYTRPSSESSESNERVMQTGAETASPSAPISQWREAVTRLNQLGVQKYQLSQTEDPFVFLFACDLSHPDNPRITHRFQAEAGEPLQAVTKVIQQVETWSAQINNR